MKRLIFAFAFALAALLMVPAEASAQKSQRDTGTGERKWFVSTSASASVTSVLGAGGGVMSASGGVGIGLHRMLGKYVSLGVNFAYTGAPQSHFLEGSLELAGYGRITDKLFLTPGLTVGVGGYVDSPYVAFAVGISPLGMEFRPSPKIGLGMSIIRLSYIRYMKTDLLNFGISPTLAVNFKF